MTIPPESIRKFRVLINTVWKDKGITIPRIEEWVQNFNGASLDEDKERALMIKLLEHFLFIGADERKELSRSLFTNLCRDLTAYPVGDDSSSAKKIISERLNKTRFAAVGGPSESSTMILYEIRTFNGLPNSIIPDLENLLEQVERGEVEYIIFIDDFCCTGQQVKERETKFINNVRTMNPNIYIGYRLLCATKSAINNLTASKLFDSVDASMVFDDDYKSFNQNSVFFKDREKDLELSKTVAHEYGRSLWCDKHSLGYKGSQMLLGFVHNVPDNTLPIFWFNENPEKWCSIFPRAHKI